jgi:hypothetical protein
MQIGKKMEYDFSAPRPFFHGPGRVRAVCYYSFQSIHIITRDKTAARGGVFSGGSRTRRRRKKIVQKP